jgi:hypothetical protein
LKKVDLGGFQNLQTDRIYGKRYIPSRKPTGGTGFPACASASYTNEQSKDYFLSF